MHESHGRAEVMLERYSVIILLKTTVKFVLCIFSYIQVSYIRL